MKTTLSMLALSVGLVAPAVAQEYGARPIDKGTPVVIVGRISSQPRNYGFIHERKLQVAVGSRAVDHTLHVGDAKIYNAQGKEIAKSDLQDKWWVRAEGTVESDPRRIHTTKLTVLGKDPGAYQHSAYYILGRDLGYVIAENVAGSREILPSTRVFAPDTRVMILAPISSQPKNAGVGVEEKLQVAIGPDKLDYTLHLKDATLRDLRGGEVFASGLKDRMWVRAEGRVMDDSRRIEVDRLTVVSDDDEKFRLSPFFGVGGEYGMIVNAERGK